MTCPFPHTRRDQTWLAVGVALGLGIMYLSAPKRLASPDMSTVAPAQGVVPEDASVSSVRHVVLLQLKDDVPEDVLNDFIAAAKELPSKIPEIMSYSAGLDLGLKSATPNHPVAITALFKDKYDYEIYATHPEHMKVVGMVKPWLTNPGGRSAAQIRGN